MAYMSQEMKKKLAPAIKAVLKKHGLKGTLSVRANSTLVIKIRSGGIDFLKNYKENCQSEYLETYIKVNPYWLETQFSDEALEALLELKDAANVDNWDNSDIRSDYFDVGWYIDIEIGTYDKPYQLV